MGDQSDAVGPGGLPPDGAAAHVVVDDVVDLVLDDEVIRHLARVRRLRAGERFTATDGAGAWRWCEWRNDAAVAAGDVHRVERVRPEIVLAFALTKADKPELVVQKATELGVDRLVPFRADRSIVRWDDRKVATAMERWRSIAMAAVAQSGSCWLPAIDPVSDVAGLATLGARRLDRSGPPPSLAHTVVAVGPEGGWSPGERDHLPETMTLGPNVLRAETAAITAGAVLCSLRAGIVGSAPRSAH